MRPSVLYALIPTMADRELMLRCDCGEEHLDIDVWLKRGLGGEPGGAEYEDSYMTILYGLGNHLHGFRSWRQRVALIWKVLRGQEHWFSEIILNPDDVAKLRDFAKELP